MKENVFFVSGIDTDTGKSYATNYGTDKASVRLPRN